MLGGNAVIAFATGRKHTVTTATIQDLSNQLAWSDPGALNWLSGLQGFTDEGEHAAYWRVADEMRGQPILDLGVGAGRTIPLLRGLSADYVAIDYLPAMVESARRKFPFVDIRVGDARDLSAFPSASVSLAVFSYAGIDAVDHDSRRLVLREIHRVLRPGGVFWFSTLNKDGVGPRERPWKLTWPRRGKLRSALHMLQVLRDTPRCLRNYARLQQLRREGEGWSIAPNAAHCYGLLVHYTTLTHQMDELALAGFRTDTLQAIDNRTGRLVGPSEDLHDVVCFNILVRK